MQRYVSLDIANCQPSVEPAVCVIHVEFTTTVYVSACKYYYKSLRYELYFQISTF